MNIKPKELVALVEAVSDLVGKAVRAERTFQEGRLAEVQKAVDHERARLLGLVDVQRRAFVRGSVASDSEKLEAELVERGYNLALTELSNRLRTRPS